MAKHKKCRIDAVKLSFLSVKKQVTQDDLASEIGKCRATIWNWTKKGTRVKNAMLLADYFGCDMEEIIVTEGDKNER